MQEFALAPRDRQDCGDGVLRQRADLEGVEESELGDFEVEAEGAAECSAKFWPVEVPGDSFLLDNGVFVAFFRIALADTGQGAVFAGDNFMGTTAGPGPWTGNEGSEGVGPGSEKEGFEGVEIGFGDESGPGGWEGGGTGDGLEGEPERGWERGHGLTINRTLNLEP